MSTEHDVSSCYDGSLARLFTYHDVSISLSCGVSIDLTDMITDHDVSIDCELIIDPDVSVDRDVPALSEHVRHHCAHTAYSASVRFFRLIH